MPRPAAMSMPEWPPLSPETLSRSATVPARGAAGESRRVQVVSMPPAQPMVSSPSSSLSRLSIIEALSQPPASALAPVMPVSSSVVMSTSSGPCFSSGSASTASAEATPMPLSAPSVVPVARSTSPSRRTWMGSLAKSWTVPSFFSQTMSTWACMATTGRPSRPGEAALRTRMLPAPSCSTWQPMALACATTQAAAAASCLEARGILESSRK